MDFTHTEGQDKEEAGKLSGHMGIEKRLEPINLTQAMQQISHLAIVGDAGSGKSALLQWAGLTVARYGRRKKIKPEQRQFVQSLGIKAWSHPICTGTYSFTRLSQPMQTQQYALYLRNPPTVPGPVCRPTIQFSEPAPRFFSQLLKTGCLLMFDGIDEVVYSDRPAGACRSGKPGHGGW